MLIALTRRVPVSINNCELTHLARSPIDYRRAVEQHAAYEEALARAGCRVERLPDAPELPDSVFVEDTAVVFDQLAVIARPGAESRRAEVDAMAAALRPYRPLVRIEAPGTLDGGDVLVTPGGVFVGMSGRTNADGARQLAAHIAPLGFSVTTVPVHGCLHLKSAVALIFPPEGGSYSETSGGSSGEKSGGSSGEKSGGSHAGAMLLINPAWVDAEHFAGFELIQVDPSEPAAANVLQIGGFLICAEEHPRTRHRLEGGGYRTLQVPAGELAKAEGGVTCCSVLVDVAG